MKAMRGAFSKADGSRQQAKSMLGCAVLLAALLLAPPAWPQGTSDAEGPPPPWEIARRESGEPSWGPLLRLRAAEPRYRDTRWWGGYLQMLAQAEAEAGNHAAALAAWDSATGRPDSMGVLPPEIETRDAVEYLVAVADTARVIMINERHHAAADRLLTLELLSRLWQKGFRYFAAEALNADDQELGSRGYPVERTGAYVREPVFAALVREAARLGFTLVPYESRGEIEEEGLTRQQRRDLEQARNLARGTIEQDPDAKVLVHAGYSHVLETVSERWYPMAVYFREITGIDPVTVDQTRLSERSEAAYEHPAYRACREAGLLGEAPIVPVDASGQPLHLADFAVDVQVLGPPTTYVHGRPRWATLGGRRHAVRVEVPEAGERWCFVEARIEGEPPEAIRLDGSEVENTDHAWLLVPPDERVVLRVLDADGNVLRTASLH